MNIQLNKHADFFFLPPRAHRHTLPRTRTSVCAHNESRFACLYVREKYVLPLSPCLNEPWHPALTAALGPPGLKLEWLTGADGARHCWALSGNIITTLTMAVHPHGSLTYRRDQHGCVLVCEGESINLSSVLFAVLYCHSLSLVETNNASPNASH